MHLFLILAALALAPAQPVQTFRLEAGDYRWIPVTIRQTPAGVDCRFDVVEGGATVHAELLPINQFRLFDRGREHDTLVTTPKGRSAQFRRVVATRGQYALVIANEKDAPPVTVALRLETNANPTNDDVAQTLSPERRLAVVCISFAFFVVTATWSSRKLILAMKRSS